MGQTEKEVNRINDIMNLTRQQKANECGETVDFFYRLCDMCDIAFSIWEDETEDLPYFVCSLSVRSFLEAMSSLFGGAYNSAGRTLRWLYEANLAGATACINPSLLDSAYSGSRNLSSDDFDNWLNRFDNGEVQLSRKRILDFYGLLTEPLNGLYEDLCKYSHISKLSFNKEETHPNLQYLPKRFDETFDVTAKTLDFALLMESKMLLCWNGGTIGALATLFRTSNPVFSALNRHFPMTVSLIKDLP